MAPGCLSGGFVCTYTYKRQPGNIFAKKINKIGLLDQKLQALTLSTFQRYRANFQAAPASHHDELATWNFNTMYRPSILTMCIKCSNIGFLERSQSTIVS